MVFPGLRGTPEAGDRRVPAESAAALAATKTLRRRVRSSASPPRGRPRSRRTSRRWRAASTTSRRWSIRRTGARASTTSPNPNGSPYEIVRRSLRRLLRQVRGTGARVVPWLQDFSLGVDYGPAEVRAQIRAARDAGVDEFLLWDPAVTYTADALDPNAKRPALGSRPSRRGRAGPVRLPDPKPRAEAVAKPPAASKQPAPRPAAERARPDPGADAPPDPGRPRRRLRPDAGRVPRRAGAALKRGLRARSASATSSTAGSTCRRA